jgi:hypothetical protein
VSRSGGSRPGRARAGRRRSPSRFGALLERVGPGALAWIVFGLALVVFLVQSRHVTKPGYETLRDRSFLLGGDEPWYLLTTRSIALGADYNLFDDLKENGFQEFWQEGVTSVGYERHVRLGHGRHATPEFWAERRYPTRPIGLPIVLAPAYRVGLLWDGQVRLACVWFLCLVGALLVQQVFLFGYDLTGSRSAAFVGALAGGLSMPIIVYVTQIYTELVAALLLVVALRMLFAEGGVSTGGAVLAGCCLGFLPWLHEKFYPPMLIGLIAFVWVARPWRFKRLAAFGVPVVVSGALLMGYYLTVYGVIYPVWDQGEPLSLGVGVRGGFLGLLFDRTDGLLPFWPVLGFGLAGLVPWLVLFVAAQWVITGMFWVWTAGMCPPLRFWVPVMPLLIVGSIYALARMRRLWLVGLMAAAMVFGVVIGARNISHPRALMKDSLPLTPSAGTLAAGEIERFYKVFPDMKVNPGVHAPSARDHALGLGWLVVAAGFVVLVVWLEGAPAPKSETEETVHDDGSAVDSGH